MGEKQGILDKLCDVVARYTNGIISRERIVGLFYDFVDSQRLSGIEMGSLFAQSITAQNIDTGETSRSDDGGKSWTMESQEEKDFKKELQQEWLKIATKDELKQAYQGIEQEVALKKMQSKVQ